MLEKIIEAILGLTAALNANTAALGNAPKAKATKATAADPAPAATATAAQASTPAAAATASPSSVSAQDAGNAMVLVANEVSRDAAVAILTKYGAEKFAGVKPEHYAAFKADCDAALKAAKEPAGAAGGLL